MTSGGTTLLWAALLLQAVGVCYLFYRSEQLRNVVNGRLPSARLPLKAGAAAPPFSLSLAGGARSLLHSGTLMGKETILLFVSPECPHCNLLASYLVERSERPTELLLICRGFDTSGCSTMGGGQIFASMVIDHADVAAHYGVAGFPVAVTIDRTWRIVRYDHVPTPEALEVVLSRRLA